jgi:uncharacterized OB-fold protein
VAQQCSDCKRFQHPPADRCLECGFQSLQFCEVSGSGSIVSFTITYDARTPAFASRQPYAIVWVELDTQEGLVLVANLSESPVEAIQIGMPVQVYFERLADGVRLPQVRLRP